MMQCKNVLLKAVQNRKRMNPYEVCLLFLSMLLQWIGNVWFKSIVKMPQDYWQMLIIVIPSFKKENRF